MKLMMITFELDNTQFLVEAESETKAISYAVAANKELGGYVDENDTMGLSLKEIENIDNYSIEDGDFNLLKEIIKRNDYAGCTEHAIIYNG